MTTFAIILFVTIVVSGATFVTQNVFGRSHNTESQPTTLDATTTPTQQHSINITSVLQAPDGFVLQGQIDLVNIYGHKVLDVCTPYSPGHNIVNLTTGVSFGPCASFLGMLKSDCELSQSRNDFAFCTDPRYSNWLVNDYGLYPPGTWNFVDDIGTLVVP